MPKSFQGFLSFKLITTHPLFSGKIQTLHPWNHHGIITYTYLLFSEIGAHKHASLVSDNACIYTHIIYNFKIHSVPLPSEGGETGSLFKPIIRGEGGWGGLLYGSFLDKIMRRYFLTFPKQAPRPH